MMNDECGMMNEKSVGFFHRSSLIICLSLLLAPSSSAAWQAATLAILPEEPAALASIDVDNDGDMDIVVSTRGNSLFLFANDGAGNYSLRDTTAGGTDARFLAVAGDRLFSSDFGSASLTEITFSPTGFATLRTTATGAFPMGLATGDLNANGGTDFAYVNLASADISIRHATPEGAFSEPTTIRIGSGPRTVAIGDIDNDGYADIVAATGAKSALVILKGTANGFATAQEFPVGASLYDVRLADLNADGKLDILTTDIGANQILAFTFDNGALRPLGNWPLPASPTAVAIADLDGDGRLDVAVATPQGLWILLGAPTGIFAAPERVLSTPVSAVIMTTPSGSAAPPQALALTQSGLIAVSWR